VRKTFLQEIRQRLEDELDQLVSKKSAQELRDADTDEIKKDPYACIPTTCNTDMNMALMERERKRIAEIGRALQKLDRGEFGACEECGERISPKRLEAILSALFCIGCQARLEKDAGRASALDEHVQIGE